MRRLRIILQHEFFIKIIAIITIIYSLIVTNFFSFKSIYNIDETNFIGIITKIEFNEDKIIINIKAKEKLIVNYYTDNPNDYNYLSLGDTIEVKGKLKIPSNNTVPNTFNYKKYLYNNKIYYTVTASNINKIKNNTSLIYYFKNKIENRINNISKTKEYLHTFILGNNKLDDISNIYQKLGISHLFSISGMHLSLFLTLITFILKRLSYNIYYKNIVTIIILIFYMLLVNTISLKRSIIMYILFSLNKLLKLKIKSIDIMLLVLIIMILSDIFIIYNLSFQYSYIISLFLIIYSKKIKEKKNYISKLLYISYISFIISFPITIYNFYQVNVLSIIFNLFYVPIVSFIIFPLSLITFIFPFLDNVLYIFINVLENISILLNKISIFNIIFPKPNLIFIILYYLIIILSFKYKKIYKLLFILIILLKIIPYLNFNTKLTMLDVGQGDSILLTMPNNKNNILIDTGGLKDYSISDNKIIPYLKSRGITKIHSMIITHGDYDHMGEAINLVENFKVEKVIFNCGKFNDLEKELIKVLYKKKIPYYSCIKELNIDDNKLYFLNNKDYGNENDNSSVIYTELNNHKFLFMGDAGVEVEEELIEKYNLQDIDVLKVGHHGSRTSSSKDFIDKIDPGYSIISVGKNNRYGHPNKEVLNNLDSSKVYRADQDGSIMFKIKNNKLKIETCTP